MVRFTNGLLRQPVAVLRSTSPPRPGLPAGLVAHTVRTRAAQRGLDAASARR